MNLFQRCINLNSKLKQLSTLRKANLSSCQAGMTNEVNEETGVQTLTLNRPQRLNAIDSKLYAAIPKALIDASEDPKVKMTVLTGSGRYFSSGNDLADFAITWKQAETPKQASEKSATILRNYVASFIEYPKPLILALNGPAVGIGATIIPLCDFVFMSSQATLRTPFASTAQAPEGCSSYTFPKLLGRALANKMLMLDHVMGAEEAKLRGLATEVFPDETFEQNLKDKVEEISNYAPNVLQGIKSISNHEKDFLHEVNEKECQNLFEVWQSDECKMAIELVMAKLGKSKAK